MTDDATHGTATAEGAGLGMSDPIKAGGPAFPVPDHSHDDYTAYKNCPEKCNIGMSLRDYFAIHAPERSIATMWPGTQEQCHAEFGKKSFEEIESILRYRYADAMLQAREEQPG